MKEITVILPDIVEAGSLSGRDVLAVVTNVGLPGPPGETGKTFVYTYPGGLTTHTGGIRVYVEHRMTIARVRASLGFPSSGQAVVLQLNKNGSPMYTTLANRPTIPIGTNTVLAALPDDYGLEIDDYLTVDIVSVGSPAPGTDLTVQIRGEFI